MIGPVCAAKRGLLPEPKVRIKRFVVILPTGRKKMDSQTLDLFEQPHV
jgi:hypothetical protein